MSNSYHHKNLKNDLIKEGKAMIKANGLQSFSLRQVAERCNVSYAAPKNHFKDKKELVKAIKDNIAEDFYQYLSNIYEQNKDSEDILILLGKGYVKYFIDNHHYYNLFFQENIVVDAISMQKNGTIYSDFKPFTFFQEIATDFLKKNGFPADTINECVISMWSLVHGIAAINTYSFFNYDGDILELTEHALTHYKYIP